MSEFETKELFSFPEMTDKVQELLQDMSGEDLALLYSKLKHDFLEWTIYNRKEHLFELTTFAPTVAGEGDHIVINGYYELPDGTIVNVCRGDNLRRKVDYSTDYGSGCQQATFKEAKSWKRRKDLRDFPNSSNPKLPYEFDLLWDIKHESELKEMLSNNSFVWLNDEGVAEVIKKYPYLAKMFLHWGKLKKL